MPVQVMITPLEAEAAVAAQVGEVRGRSFTYSPAETVALCEKINATGHEGAHRLVTRLADIYGKNFITGRPAASPKFQRTLAKVEEAFKGRIYVHKDEPSPAPKRKRGKVATQVIIDDPLANIETGGDSTPE